MKVYVVGSSIGYMNFLEGATRVDSVEEAEVVLFTGGEDVDPSIYECERRPETYSNLNRDLKEKEIFDSIKPNQLALGICRGLNEAHVKHGELLES